MAQRGLQTWNVWYTSSWSMDKCLYTFFAYQSLDTYVEGFEFMDLRATLVMWSYDTQMTFDSQAKWVDYRDSYGIDINLLSVVEMYYIIDYCQPAWLEIVERFKEADLFYNRLSNIVMHSYDYPGVYDSNIDWYAIKGRFIYDYMFQYQIRLKL